MVNVRERLEILLNKTIDFKQGMYDTDYEVYVGFIHDENGGIPVEEINNERILEWKLAEKQPTQKQLESVTDDIITKHENLKFFKTCVKDCCVQFLSDTNFKFLNNYDGTVSEALVMDRQQALEIIRGVDDKGVYPNIDEIPLKVKTIFDEKVNMRNMYKTQF